MENENFVANLANRLGQDASIKNVYGEPIRVGEKTIIPVAQIAYGFGGGFGSGMNKQKPLKDAGAADANGKTGEGAGGGGGMYAKPKGVYEITAACTRFIPASNTKRMLMAMFAGFIIRGWISSRRKR
jgi:uncharacterized spore protein YtfJ